MPSKSTILKKIREIENELNKLKVMYFEHYNSQETKLDTNSLVDSNLINEVAVKDNSLKRRSENKTDSSPDLNNYEEISSYRYDSKDEKMLRLIYWKSPTIQVTKYFKIKELINSPKQSEGGEDSCLSSSSVDAVSTNSAPNDKFILDACCSGRMMWYNKKHPNCLYMDIRKEDKGFIKDVPNFEVNPDIVGDFRNLPEEVKQKKFKLIVWDIPHFKAKELSGVFLKKFGGLNPETWPYDVNKGFNELWGVLEDYGVLIMKFSNHHIKFDNLLEHIPIEPLFYNKTSGTDNKTETRWFCFMKIPEFRIQDFSVLDKKSELKEKQC